MPAFIKSLPDKIVILMVIFYRGHVYYVEGVDALGQLCPYVPLWLDEAQSNALVCLKGIGHPSWAESKLSLYSQGPAVIDKEILLPKGTK